MALSGGSDSIALTLLLRDLAANSGFAVVSIAHLNHQLRHTAARDEQFCRAFSAQVEIPIHLESADVAAYAAGQRLSLEEAARRVRYDFLSRAAAAAGADRIAVGHTRDDQAETFLLKLMRGAGLTGLAGIYPRRDAVIRPLLEVGREELRAWLRERGQGWIEDETNQDIANPRNRVRHVVIPELDRTYGGATSPAIARAAGLIREDTQWLDGLAAARLAHLAVRTPAAIEFDAAALQAEPAPIRRRVVLEALRGVSGGREVGLEHVEAALGVLQGLCTAWDLPGSRVELRRGKLVLMDQGAAPK